MASGTIAIPSLFAATVLFGAVFTWLWYLRPSVSEATVIAFLPWAAVAASLSVFAKHSTVPVRVVPPESQLQFYLLVFGLAGGVWGLATTTTSETSSWTVPEVLGLSGILLLAPIVGATLTPGGTSYLLWAVAGIVVPITLTALTWDVLEAYAPRLAADAGSLERIVVFAHLFDGVTTIIGVDVLGLVEQTPFSRVVLETAATFPTAGLLGVGWAFAVLKLVFAILVIWSVNVFFKHDSRKRSILLGIAAITGFGPGFHNLLLYLTFT